MALKHDQKYLGTEPTKVTNQLELVKALNWYGYFFDRETGKKWILDFMRVTKMAEDIPAFLAAPDIKVNSTMCAVARLLVRGNKLPDSTVDRFLDSLDEIIDLGYDVMEDRRRKAAIRLRDKNANKADDLIAELEDELDILYRNGYKSDFNMADWLDEKKLKPAMIEAILLYYTPLLDEICKYPEDFPTTKAQHKNYIAFVMKLINDCVAYGRVVKEETPPVVRKPRKPKEVSPDKLVKGVKFKKENPQLKLVSINPKSVIGGKVLVMYNDKYKVMSILNAANGQTLSIKGTTVIGLDANNCVAKTVRHPNTIPAMISGGIRQFKQSFDGLNSKEKLATGRLNDDTLILKVFK